MVKTTDTSWVDTREGLCWGVARLSVLVTLVSLGLMLPQMAGAAAVRKPVPEPGRYVCLVAVADPLIGVRLFPFVGGDLVLNRTLAYRFTRSGQRGQVRVAARTRKLSFTGILARSRTRFLAGGGLLTFQIAVPAGSGRRLDAECSKKAVKPLPRPAVLNGGFKGILTGEGSPNTITEFSLGTGRLVRTLRGYAGTRGANGELVFVNGADLNRRSIDVAGPDGLTRVQIPCGLPFCASARSRPVLSTDGTLIAVDGVESFTPPGGIFPVELLKLFVLGRDGRVVAALQDADRGSLDGPNWSFAPDGALVFVGPNGSLQEVVPASGARRVLVAEPSALPAVRHDGGQIAYVRGTTLWLADRNGAGARPLTVFAGQVMSIAWAPAGNAVMVILQRTPLARREILIVRTSTGRFFNVTDAAGNPIFAGATPISWR